MVRLFFALALSIWLVLAPMHPPLAPNVGALYARYVTIECEYAELRRAQWIEVDPETLHV
jgi:hypothetical protein